MHAEAKKGSKVAAVVRTILWALAIAFIVGFVIGSLIRRQVEEPTRYIGFLDSRGSTGSTGDRSVSVPIIESVAATDPRHIADSEARVFMARDHEEQVG